MARKDVTNGFISEDMTDANDNFIELYAAMDTKVALTGDETIADVKTFTSSPVVPTPTTDMQASTKKYADDGLALKVDNTGNETIAGIKTFSSSPIVPTPTTDMQAGTKKYTDDTITALGLGTASTKDTGTDAGDVPLNSDLGDASTKTVGTATGNLVLADNFPANRNVIINGGFFVNQRGYVSNTPTTGADEYTLDRWRVVTSGQDITFSDSGGKRTVTAPAGGIEQEIEGTFLQTGTYTISWEGTATCTVDATARTTGEAFTITGGSNVTVKFSGGTVANVQLEFGSLETPFEQRSYGVELALCMRYYQAPTNLFKFEVINSYMRHSLQFAVPMRSSPTITFSNNTNTMTTEAITSTGFTPRNSIVLASESLPAFNWAADAEL